MKHKNKQKHLEDKTARMSRGPCNTQEDTPQGQSPPEATACSPDFSKRFACVFAPLKRLLRDKDGPCNTQEDTPQCQSPAEATACCPDFSNRFICIFSTLKRLGLDKDGPCNTQEDTPQRQSPAEATARSQAAGDRPDFSERFACVFAPLKLPGLDKDGPCNTQDDATLPMSTGETTACSQAAGDKPDFSERFVCVFAPLKLPGLDKDVSQQSDGKVSSTGAFEKPAGQSDRKQESTNGHLQAKLDSQEEALQHRHQAGAITQSESESTASSSDSVIFLSSKDKRTGAEPCISQDNVAQLESSVEASACSYPTGEEYSFSEHPIGVSTTSKRPRLDEDAKLDSREEALQHRHQAGAITQSESESMASSSDSVIFLSSKDKRTGAEHRISQDNVAQSESSVEASACSYPTGEEYSFSEHSIGVSTPSKRPRLDENVSQQSDGKVSSTGAFEKPASQSDRKQQSTNGHLQENLNSREEALQHRHQAGAITQSKSESTASSSDSVIFLSSKDKRTGAEHRISQDNVAQSESSVEASACSYPTGEEYSFSEHSIGVSTPSKRPRLDEDVSQQSDGKVSSTGAFEKPASQSDRKQESTNGHLRAKLDSQEEALQHRHQAGTITQSKSESMASSSDSVIFLSSKDKRTGAEHRISQDNVTQSESSVEASACSYPTGEEYSFSEHSIGVSTPSKRPRLDEDVSQQSDGKVSSTGAFEKPASQSDRKQESTNGHLRAKLDSREEALQHRHQAVAITQSESESTASSSDSVIFLSSKDKRTGAEHRISQDNMPQSESSVEASACSYPTGEESSFSEHLIGDSTTIKRPLLDEDGKDYTEIKEMPVSRVLEQTEDTSDYSHNEIPSHAFNNNEPVMSPVPGTEQRLKKIYYMRVQLKRGVAVLYHTKEGWVPPSKKVKMEEMFYIGKVHKNVPDSHMSEDEHLISPEPILDSRAQDKREEADSPAQPPAQSWYPSAKTPEWLLAQDTGFRCMACCRVFQSLEVLQEHVECGVREGFSCHVYHKAMTILKYEEHQRKEKEKRIRQRLDARRKII